VSAWKEAVEQRTTRLSEQLQQLSANSVCGNSLAAVKDTLEEQLRLAATRSVEQQAATRERMSWS